MGALKDKWQKLYNQVLAMEADVDKADSSGVKASVRRARKSLQEIKVTAQEFRKELQEAIS